VLQTWRRSTAGSVRLLVVQGLALATLVAVVALGVKLLVAGAVIAAAEVFMAKVRLFKVPELLAGSFVLAFLAVTASYLAG
jgi:formate hydrogenlyase subunit 4